MNKDIYLNKEFNLLITMNKILITLLVLISILFVGCTAENIIYENLTETSIDTNESINQSVPVLENVSQNDSQEIQELQIEELKNISN